MADFGEWRRMWQGIIAVQSQQEMPDPTRFAIGDPLCS
jgi:hypothetical protein